MEKDIRYDTIFGQICNHNLTDIRIIKKKNNIQVQGHPQQNAFEKVKTKMLLTEAPMLTYNKKNNCQCYRLEAALYQEWYEKSEVIAYAPRTLTQTKKKTCSLKKECLQRLLISYLL